MSTNRQYWSTLGIDNGQNVDHIIFLKPRKNNSEARMAPYKLRYYSGSSFIF